MLFDAATLARAWLAVSIAAGDDEAQPQLYRTTSLALYPHGVRLVATDGVLLLHAFVPSHDADLEPEPSIDDMPVAWGVAADPHRRALSLLKHLLRLEKGDEVDRPHNVVRLSLGVVDDRPAPAATFEGMESRWVVLEEPHTEKVRLQAYSGGYPVWQTVVGSFAAEASEGVAFGPDMLARLSRLARLYPSAPLVCRFGGADAMAHVELVSSDPHVEGLVGLVHWDFAAGRSVWKQGAEQDEPAA